MSGRECQNVDHDVKDRMQVHWKKMQGNALSFFALLDQVREEIGDAALASWCLNEIGIGMSRITRVQGILKKEDEDAVKARLKAAREHARPGYRHRLKKV
jgi:hypothetical protein